MLIIAHRGASADATENTLEAFRLAWRQGADAIETDLRLTADGEVVALHDPALSRIHGSNRFLHRTTLSDLHRVAPRVPTLADILAISPPSAHLVLELKVGPELFAPIATSLASRRDLQITFIAFDYDLITATKQRFPEHSALWLVDEIPIGLINKLDAANLDGIDLRYSPRLRRSRVLALRKRTLYTFTVNDQVSASHCAHLGIEALTTDHPHLARSWVAQDSSLR